VKASKAYGLLKTSLKYQTKEFFENSTLHGVRYVAEKGRPFTEKFMWFCLVAVGAVAAFVIIGSLWEKFQTNPTITGTFVKSYSCTHLNYSVFHNIPYNIDFSFPTIFFYVPFSI
jgi:Amiloride-sensitive sodium channel